MSTTPKKKTLISREDIERKVKEMGAQITADYPDKTRKLIVISVLKGAMVFTADLIREIKRPVVLEVLIAGSYGAKTESSGEVNLKYFSFDTLKGADVLLVDDITDTGRTLLAIGERLKKEYHPLSLKYCTFLDKPARRVVDLQADYIGYEIPDEFVVGYGLDFAEDYRDLPEIAIIEP